MRSPLKKELAGTFGCGRKGVDKVVLGSFGAEGESIFSVAELFDLTPADSTPLAVRLEGFFGELDDPAAIHANHPGLVFHRYLMEFDAIESDATRLVEKPFHCFPPICAAQMSEPFSYESLNAKKLQLCPSSSTRKLICSRKIRKFHTFDETFRLILKFRN